MTASGRVGRTLKGEAMGHAQPGKRRLACLPTALMVALVFPSIALADTPTPTDTATPGVTASPTDRPTPRPTARPTLAPTVTLPPAPAVQRPTAALEPTNRPRHHRPQLDQSTATATPAPPRHHHKRHHRKAKHRAKSKRTPTPKPTSTPALNLQAEDSVTPVTCNGKKTPDASRPFLYTPFRGWNSIVSYVDHDMPNYQADGTIITATGASAFPDSLHHGSGFPAYWDKSLRQYLYYDGHNGYDFNLWYQPVYAAAAGKVIFAAYEYPDLPDHGYGKMVMIDHGHGYVTLYGHFSRILVKKGEKVHAGQRIGISGNTGHSSGPHLHFTVFHNCTPTDPYGWSGSGPDPLQSFQGETSTYLWRRAPLIANPPPGWPDLTSLPAASVTRIALLRLPKTSGGTGVFTRTLELEVRRAAAILRKQGLFVHADPLKGALTVTGTSTAEQVYRVGDVVSLTTPDTEEGDSQDVLHALALAAQVTNHKRFRLARSTAWTGFLLNWRHTTFLVGTGSKGGDVNLQLDDNGQQVAVHRLQADPQTGAFAANLGDLTKEQKVKLTAELEGRGSGGSSIVTPTRTHHKQAAQRHSSGTPWRAIVTLLLVLGVACSAFAYSPLRSSLRRTEEKL